MKILQPENWKEPRGYSNGILATGNFLFVAGQIGWNDSCELVGSDLVQQTRQALQNIVTVLQEGGAEPQNIARMTWYVTDKKDYLDHAKEIGAVYRELIGTHYPVMSLIEVSALLEEGAKVEIEATAVVP